MCSIGDCFLVLSPHCAEKTVIFGRNSGQVEESAAGQAQEVIYYDASASSDGKCDGGAEPEVIGSLRVILQKPLPRIWGGDYGANEKNVCIGIAWTADQPSAESGHLLATDIVRCAKVFLSNLVITNCRKFLAILSLAASGHKKKESLFLA